MLCITERKTRPVITDVAWSVLLCVTVGAPIGRGVLWVVNRRGGEFTNDLRKVLRQSEDKISRQGYNQFTKHRKVIFALHTPASDAGIVSFFLPMMRQ